MRQKTALFENLVCPDRRGAVLTQATGALVLVLGFAAFTTDLGYIMVTSSELQTAADASALGAGLELCDGLGLEGSAGVDQVGIDAGRAAGILAAAHRAGDVESLDMVPGRDMRLGRYEWDDASNSWLEVWGAKPYNLVEVTLRRTNGDRANGPLSLTFASVFDSNSAELTSQAAAAIIAGQGFTASVGPNANLMPLALDLETWLEIVAGNGADDFAFDDDLGVVRGKDGIPEFTLYPDDDRSLPPGNRGVLTIGPTGAATRVRQILEGVTPADLEVFGGTLDVSEGPVIIPGETGLVASLESPLKTIIGQTRAIAVFTDVRDPGANARYTINKFVGVRVLDVRLSGRRKYLTVQPATVVDPTVIPSEKADGNDSLFAPVQLIR